MVTVTITKAARMTTHPAMRRAAALCDSLTGDLFDVKSATTTNNNYIIT